MVRRRGNVTGEGTGAAKGGKRGKTGQKPRPGSIAESQQQHLSIIREGRLPQQSKPLERTATMMLTAVHWKRKAKRRGGNHRGSGIIMTVCLAMCVALHLAAVVTASSDDVLC